MHDRCTKNGITNASMQVFHMINASAEERCRAIYEAVNGGE
jgi:hypothetical protein